MKYMTYEDISKFIKNEKIIYLGIIFITLVYGAFFNNFGFNIKGSMYDNLGIYVGIKSTLGMIYNLCYLSFFIYIPFVIYYKHLKYLDNIYPRVGKKHILIYKLLVISIITLFFKFIIYAIVSFNFRNLLFSLFIKDYIYTILYQMIIINIMLNYKEKFALGCYIFVILLQLVFPFISLYYVDNYFIILLISINIIIYNESSANIHYLFESGD